MNTGNNLSPCTGIGGYLHPLYAKSLAEFGEPLVLPRSCGWLLKRSIPGTDLFDAMGCYPLFCCQDWRRLGEDLAALENHLVSVALVADPFGGYDEALLRGTFDVVIPFKEHFISDLSQPWEKYISKHHRQVARRSLRDNTVEVCSNPLDYLDDWTNIYGNLIEKHAITGMRSFSRDSFARQLAVPGLVLIRASRNGESLGFNLVYVQGDIAYTHLAAVSPLGYKLSSSYALTSCSFNHFTGKVRWMNLGAAAGATGNTGGGLAFFKQGWSSGTRQAWFCGKILNRPAYDKLVQEGGFGETSYFPAYRKGEFS